MAVVDRIVEHAERLTAAERKVAEVLASDPQVIAFGTVAQVAARAATSGPSVVRLAVKLGYKGFIQLQAEVQQELARQLGPAHDRIRQQTPTDLLDKIHDSELANVEASLRSLDEATLASSAARIADRHRNVWILTGDVTFPVGVTLANQVGQLRERVEVLAGSEVAVSRRLAGLTAGDVVIAVDIRRYERWLVRLLQHAASRDASITALTDSPLSPLVAPATEAFFFSARGVGPFDSLTGAMALANALGAAVAARLRSSAAARLDAIEDAWTDNHMLMAAPVVRSVSEHHAALPHARTRPFDTGPLNDTAPARERGAAGVI